MGGTIDQFPTALLTSGMIKDCAMMYTTIFSLIYKVRG